MSATEATQSDRMRCECGQMVAVYRLLSPHNFAWKYEACTRSGVISWAGDAPPPAWKPSAQGELFG